MAEDESGQGRSSSMKVDTALVRELADLLNETGLSEIEVEDGNRKIRVSRGAMAALSATPAGQSASPPAYPLEASASPSTYPPETATTMAMANAVRSPMVGTVYLAGEPGSDPFVKTGDRVSAGDTLLIVEAMKVMNPITAPRDGVVQDILVENAQPIEFDQPLIRLG